jgi:GNAT superfamily N-acetyltransferase
MNPVAKRVVVDEARREDLETVLQLYAENEDQPTDVLDLPAALTIWRRFNIYPNYKLYVARTNDEVVGTFALLIMDNLARFGAKSGIVEDVIVARKWQRRGIGRLMLHFALEQCRALAKKHSQQAGCEWLHVDFDGWLSEFFIGACGFCQRAAGVNTIARRLARDLNFERF